MRDKEEKNITEIMGLSDDVIKNYLRSNPDKAKKLALTLISLDKERTQRREFHKSVSLTQRRSAASMVMFGVARAYAEAIKGNPFAIILVVIFLLIIIITAILRSLYSS